MTKQMKYVVGQTYSVALNLLVLPDVKLTSRFALGNNFLSVKADIERQSQLIPCAAQLLSEEQQAANKDKLFLLTEGIHGRYEIAKLLGRELLIQLTEPKSDAGILERDIASNGPRSAMSAMDISVAANRLEGQGFSVERACQLLSWVAGKGKPLGTQRYWQYKRLTGLPVEIQKMAHLGIEKGGMRLDAALSLTNRKLTEDQYKAILANVMDARKRMAHEEWERDKAYMERDKDAVLKAAMGQELPSEPAYTPKKRAKAADETVTTTDVETAMQEMGISKKPDTRPDPNPPADPGSPLTHAELMADLAKLKELGGLYIELAECIEARSTRRISSQDFCEQIKALFENGSPTAKVTRRKIREKAGQAEPLVAVK